MGVRFACHACGKRLNIKTELAGKRGICPACSVRFRIPPYDTELSTPLESDESDESVSGSTMSASSKSLTARSIASDESLHSGGVAVQDSPQSRDEADSSEIDAEPDRPSPARTSKPVSLSEVLGDTSATWYVRPPSGGQYGPADGPTMGQWMKEGRVADVAMVWRDGWTDWRQAKDAIPGVVPTSTGKTDTSAHSLATATTTAPTPVTGSSEPIHPDVNERSGPLGSNKKKRSQKRVVASVVLGLVCLGLVGVLVVVLTRN